jgi:acyl carrier protein
VVGRVAAADPQPRRIDLAALAARLTERRDPPVREVAGRFFTLGPRWDNVREIRSRPGDRSEQLLHLELPERFAAEAAEHALHPTLLDAATAYARDSRHEAPHLPFMYRSMVVHGPLPARLSSSIRRGEGSPDMIVADVDLVDADGQVLVEISGFTMRRVKDEMPAFAATLRADAPPAPSASPPRQPAPPAGQAAPVPPAGLPPETGGRLFMDLLGARTPRQVAVLPYRNGVPLPLDAAPDASVPVAGTAGVPIGAATTPAAGPVPAQATAPSAVTPAEPVPVAGGDPVEARLGALWTEALGVVDIAATDDFFDLGGNSLSAVELMSRIQDTFHVELSITALFDYPTLQAFADELRRMGAR